MYDLRFVPRWPFLWPTSDPTSSVSFCQESKQQKIEYNSIFWLYKDKLYLHPSLFEVKKAVVFDRFTNFFHQVQEKMQVVKRCQSVGQELFGFEEVMQIGTGVVFTSKTGTGWINRASIVKKFSFGDIYSVIPLAVGFCAF